MPELPYVDRVPEWQPIEQAEKDGTYISVPVTYEGTDQFCLLPARWDVYRDAWVTHEGIMNPQPTRFCEVFDGDPLGYVITLANGISM